MKAEKTAPRVASRTLWNPSSKRSWRASRRDIFVALEAAARAAHRLEPTSTTAAHEHPPVRRGRRAREGQHQVEDRPRPGAGEASPKADFPWFWDGKEFKGDRVNDVHLSNEEKQQAREAKGVR